MWRPALNSLCRTSSGQTYHVREGELSDAAELIRHSQVMLADPRWNVTEPDEFLPSLDLEEGWILGFRERPHNMLLVADFGTIQEPRLAGMLSFVVQSRRRLRHRGRLGIGVEEPYRRQGIGAALLSELLRWAAAEPELERVELSVLAHNARAIGLYRKLGFVEEARIPKAYKLANGEYYDDLQMVKWVK
jgi:RimJ/RimL family protein N-acetyltransferase